MINQQLSSESGLQPVFELANVLLNKLNLLLQDWNTPLHIAATNGHEEAIIALITAKAEVDAKTKVCISHMTMVVL
jgi:ankyrin repeat protein